MRIRTSLATLILALFPLGGCTPNTGHTDEEYDSNGDPYRSASVGWQAPEKKRSAPKPDLQPLPPDVKQDLSH